RQVAVGVGAERLAVRGDERVAQRRQRGDVRLRDQQLARVGAAVELHGDRFAAPDQLGAALAEMLPAPPRQIARVSVGGTVPAFHRQDAEPVAGAEAVELERPRQRRYAWWIERIVELNRRATLLQVLAKRRRRFQ